jgi:hypothetical protein
MSKNRSVFIAILLLFLLTSTELYAQRKKRSDFYGKSNIEMFRKKYGRHGIIAAVGVTSMFSNDDRRATVYDLDPTQEYFFRSNGKIGFMAEVGMLHFTKTRKRKFLIIDHYDWAIGVKTFRGWEETRLVERFVDGAVGTTGRGEFSLGYLTGRFGVHNMVKLSKRVSLDHGPGVNVDYRMFGSTPGDNSNYQPIVLPTTQTFQQDFLAQVHYEVGIRIRAYRMIHITPMVQMPVLSAYQWSGGRSSIQWFSSRYQPIIFKLKFYFPIPSKKGGCPAVHGSPDDERRNQEYMEGK